jgi:hypothetical protein
MRAYSSRITLAAVTLALLGALAGCGGGAGGGGNNVGGNNGGGNNGGGNNGGGTPAPQTRVYRGNSTVTYSVFNILGQYVGDYQYTGPVVVQIDPSPDNNPISLGAFNTTDPRGDGQFSILSNGVINTNSGPLSLHYWDLQLNGANLTGTLVNNFGDLSAANVNAFFAPSQLGLSNSDWASAQVFILQAGTTLSGTVTEQEVRLRIQASNQIFSRPFVADIVASRSQ